MCITLVEVSVLPHTQLCTISTMHQSVRWSKKEAVEEFRGFWVKPKIFIPKWLPHVVGQRTLSFVPWHISPSHLLLARCHFKSACDVICFMVVLQAAGESSTIYSFLSVLAVSACACVCEFDWAGVCFFLCPMHCLFYSIYIFCGIPFI